MPKPNETPEEIWKRANAGDADAIHFVATECREQKLYAAALRNLRRAAKAGYAPAQNDYATMLLNGVRIEDDPDPEGFGIEVDADEAVIWYRKAAEQGLAVAQYNLGTRYRIGEGVPLDLEEAARWLTKSAEQGYVEASGDLGVAYRFGRGVPQDLVRAAELFVLAAHHDDVIAIGNLADIVDKLTSLAEQGNQRAQLALVEIYENGYAVDQDRERARYWRGRAGRIQLE